MDNFKYMAAVKQLELCNLVSEMEKHVRKYNSLCNKHNLKWTDFSSCEQPYEETKHVFKCYAYSLKRFKEMSSRTLPAFLYEDYRRIQTNLLKRLFLHNSYMNPAREYKELMDLLEFSPDIYMPLGVDNVEILNSIILDNPVHFRTINWNNRLTDFDRNSTQLNKAEGLLTYAIRHKQVNFPDKPQTIWDWYMKDLEASIDKQTKPDIDSDIIKLKQQIAALEGLKDYYE